MEIETYNTKSVDFSKCMEYETMETIGKIQSRKHSLQSNEDEFRHFPHKRTKSSDDIFLKNANSDKMETNQDTCSKNSKFYIPTNEERLPEMGRLSLSPSFSRFQERRFCDEDEISLGPVTIRLSFRGRVKFTTLTLFSRRELKNFVYYKFPEARRRAWNLLKPDTIKENATLKFHLIKNGMRIPLTDDEDFQNILENELVEVDLKDLFPQKRQNFCGIR